LVEVRALHARILAGTGGNLIDLDATVDEPRGFVDEPSPRQ
jgi:hypothetical protein